MLSCIKRCQWMKHDKLLVYHFCPSAECNDPSNQENLEVASNLHPGRSCPEWPHGRYSCLVKTSSASLKPSKRVHLYHVPENKFMICITINTVCIKSSNRYKSATLSWLSKLTRLKKHPRTEFILYELKNNIWIHPNGNEYRTLLE